MLSSRSHSDGRGEESASIISTFIYKTKIGSYKYLLKTVHGMKMMEGGFNHKRTL